MLRKIKKQNGSAMSLAIALIAIVTIIGSSITMMVNNQMKVYQVNSRHTNLKYDTEKGIEEVIGKFIENIKVVGRNDEFSETGVLQSYVELADIIVASNGKFNSAVNDVLNRIKQGVATKQDMNTLIIEMNKLGTMVGKSNPDAKELIGIAVEYATFFMDNFFNENSNGVSTEVAKEFIKKIINNLSTREFKTGNGNNSGTYYGNVGVVYRDLVTISKKGEPFKSIYTEFKNNNSTNVAGKLKNLDNLTENDIDRILSSINSTNYIENIKLEMNNVSKGSYLNEKEIKHYYSTTGNVKNIDNVSKRLQIVKKEIDMLVQWLNAIKGNMQGTEGETTIVSSLQVQVPAQVTESNGKTISITPVENDNITSTKKIVDELEIYEINILSPSASTNILINLDIQSKTDEYTIEADVDVNIYGIVSEVDYKVEYSVTNWNKKID